MGVYEKNVTNKSNTDQDKVYTESSRRLLTALAVLPRALEAATLCTLRHVHETTKWEELEGNTNGDQIEITRLLEGAFFTLLEAAATPSPPL